MKEIGLYIHIPFCQKKCHYCDFVSYENKKELVEEYIKWLIFDIRGVAEGIKLDKKEITIKTIYIGGGTPSFIEAVHIEEILKTIYDNFNIKQEAEITIEVNPRNSKQR